MICRECAYGAALAFDFRQQFPDVPGMRRSKLAANQRNGKLRRISNAHGRCRGRTWCDCQHWGTPHYRTPRERARKAWYELTGHQA